ncbi:MAG TPA: MFS transporter, partial [Methylomirabilota bacterium]|nr:MFS transporter [Methylomirabilota bacterium]
LYSAVGIVGQPLVGPWVDAVGRRPFMVTGVALVLAGSLLAALAGGGVGLLAVVRLLQGLGFSAYFVASFAYVVDIVEPERRGWALGIYGVSGLLSMALAPLLGEWIVRRFGFRPLFVASASLALLAAALVWRLEEARPRGTVPVRPGALVRGGFEDLLHRHMAVALFFGLGAGTIATFLPTFAEDLGVTTLSLFYTAYGVAAIGVRVLGGRLIDTRGRRAVIVPSMFVQAVATSLLALLGLLVTRRSATPVVPVLVVAGLLSGGAHGFVYPGLAALVADQTPPARRAAVVGVFSAMFLIGQTAGAFVFGYVAHALGYTSMWSVLTGLLVIGGALSLGLAADRSPRAA